MADIALGAFLFSVSGIVGILLYQLDKLIGQVDADTVRPETLDTMEVQVIEWILVPLAKQIAPTAEVLPTRDVEKIRAAYHYNIAAIERARQCARDFDEFKIGLHRSLVAGALLLVPAGVLIAVPAQDGWLSAVVFALLFVFTGFIFSAAYAFLLMRKARKQYASVTNALRERISGQSLARLRSHPPGGEGYA